VGEAKKSAGNPGLARAGLHSVTMKRNAAWWYPHGTHIAPTMWYDYVLEFRHYKKGNWAFSDEQDTYFKHTAVKIANPRHGKFTSTRPTQG
jgi:hypothetical protein